MTSPASGGAPAGIARLRGTGGFFWEAPGRLEMLFFFLHPLALGCWLVRIADVQNQLWLSKAEFATALLGFPVGSLLVLVPSTYLISRLGLKRLWRLSFVVFSVGIVALGHAVGTFTLALGLGLVAGSLLLTQLCMNIQVNCVERDEGVNVMSRCHGFFMVGLLGGSLLGLLLDFADVSPASSFLICALLGLVAGLATLARIGERKLQDPAITKLGLPSPALLPVLLYLMGNTMTEGMIGAWTTIYLDDINGAPSDYSGLGFVLFTAVFALGRLAGDHAKRFGTVRMARLCCLVAIASVALVASGAMALVFVGLALCGLGIAFGFPYTMSTAAKIPGDATVNATYVMFTAVMCFQFGPVVLGYVAAASSLSVAFALLIPILLLSLYGTRSLR